VAPSTPTPSTAPPAGGSLAGGDTPATTAAPAVGADDPVLDMSIRDIGALMARVVTRGHAEQEKRELEAQITAGVEAYRLTALVLCARRPPSEVLARSVLCKRTPADAEDGVFWSVVEFIERSRNGELARIISAPPV
jgi:hypothetical protein